MTTYFDKNENSHGRNSFFSFFSFAILIAALFFNGIEDLNGQCTVDQIHKFLPSSSANLNDFGSSVAIDGSYAIAGVELDSANGFETGTAYLFDIETGAQLFELLPNQSIEFDFYGSSVAVSGDIALVGARGDFNDTGNFSGSVYLFDVTTGLEVGKIVPNDVDVLDEFGYSESVSGRTALIGARGDDDQGLFSGSAYLFDATTGQQVLKLLPDDGTALNRFCNSVSIDGNTAVIGAFRYNGNSDEMGTVYVFDLQTCVQIQRIVSDDIAIFDHFGNSVAIASAFLVVAHQNTRKNNPKLSPSSCRWLGTFN